MKKLRAKQYIPIGSSSFNGRYEDERVIKAQAARVGATVVLVYAVSSSSHAAAPQQRYDQVAVFFVKSTKKLKFGVSVADLSHGQRSALDRNTGALLDIVMENSPAFTANVLPGDILVEVNGVSVLNAKHAIELMLNAAVSKGTALLKVIRKGEEKAITITF
jgi:S1-C subfamily serine protease